MVWVQILSISIASGIWLYYIGRIHDSHKKRLHYAIFLFCTPILVSILVINEQFIISSPNYFGVEMLELVSFHLAISIEAIYTAKCVKQFISKDNIFYFVPLYVVCLWILTFLTIVIVGLVYPGS